MSDSLELGIDLTRVEGGARQLYEILSIDNLESFEKFSSLYFGNIAFDGKQIGFRTAPFITSFMNPNEEASSLKAIKNGQTDYKLGDFVYNVNKYGFRGDFCLDSIVSPSIATFGCSFTFGVGCSEEFLWPNIMAEQLEHDLYNFGCGGTSIEYADVLYSIVSRFARFEKVVVLIPSFMRTFIPSRSSYFGVSFYNFLPNFSFNEPKIESKRILVYDAVDETYMRYRTIRSIQSMINTAKANDTEIYFSAWEDKTYKILWEGFKDKANILPFHQTHRGLFGRDGAHAGKQSNLYMGSTYAEIIDSKG